jgi:hypothetical protein
MTMTTEQVRTQTFYCPGCDSYHEAESLLEVVRLEAEKIKREQSAPIITLGSGGNEQ